MKNLMLVLKCLLLLFGITGLIVAPGLLSAQGQYFSDETFERMPVIPDRSMDADFGDIDGDDDLDIIVSNSEYSVQPNLIYINNGTGYFTEETESRMPLLYKNTADSELCDVDRDGDLDIVAANFTSVAEDYMDLFLNDGRGVFVEMSNWLPSRSVSFLTGVDLGDIQGSLYLDIINSNYGSNRLLMNYTTVYYIAPESQYPRGSDDSSDIFFADVDGDFDLDVLVINGTGENNRLLINNGAGSYVDETNERLPDDTQEGSGGAIVDIDGDGDLDIFVANAYIPARNLLWVNDGTGRFVDESEGRMPIYGDVSIGASFGDIDNDGDFDLLIPNLASGGISTKVFINDGTGHFTDETATRYPSDEDEAVDIAVGDIDNDGDIDLYVANIGDHPAQEQNRLLINNSTPDSFPPSIVRTFIHEDTGDTAKDYLITSTVWDNIAVARGELKASLYYQAFEDSTFRHSSSFTEIPMLWSGGSLYREKIPAQLSITTVEYYIKAEDKMGNISYDPPDAPDSVFSFLVDVNVGIGDDPPSMPSLPKAFSLAQNYPNPFNPSTTIGYSIPAGEAVHVDLKIYDLRGQLVRSLISEEKEPGHYSTHWDGKNNRSQTVGSGVYLYRIEFGSFTAIRKMTILR